MRSRKLTYIQKMSFLVPLIVSLLTVCARSQTSLGFKCQSSATCRAMAGFSPENKTTIDAVQKLFHVADLETLLSANGLLPSTLPTLAIQPSQALKIPFDCICSRSNLYGVASNPPLYTVKSGDTLDIIASKIFSRLVTFLQIATFNKIADPNLIEVGQNVSIPLPCSCDRVDGVDVLHYEHVVSPGSNVSGIAQQFGVSDEILLSLNGMANASSLLAYQLLDIPLRVCNSSVTNSSLDYPMLVPVGTYFYTANNCVNCSCGPAGNFTLQCSSSGIENLNCPSMTCSGLALGNTTTTACSSSTCSYIGVHNNGSILTETVTQDSCQNHHSGAHVHAKFKFWKSAVVTILAVLSTYIM